MVDAPLNASRRRRTASATASGSVMLGGSSFGSIAIALILIATAATCLIIPDEIDEALGGASTAISDQKEVASQALASVVSFTTETDDDGAPQAASAASAAVLEHGEELASGDARRTVLTSGHDILLLEPQSEIVVGGEPKSPATIIELLYGTLNVEAAKRNDGESLSIETPFLVATVKGTKFEVTTTDSGAAVSVTEGLVSVRSTRSGEGLDIEPGYTAVVSAVHGTMPTIVATTDGGASAAIEAAVSGSVSNSNHHRR